MTNRQRIELRLSEVRERLNEISGLEGDDFTDDVRAEAGKLQAEYKTLEIRHRAAIVADPDPDPGDGDGAADGDDPKLLELRGRVSIADYIEAARAGRPVTGAAAEYNAALDMAEGRFPLQLLDDGEPLETRATTDTDGPVQSGLLDRSAVRGHGGAARGRDVRFRRAGPGVVSGHDGGRVGGAAGPDGRHG